MIVLQREDNRTQKPKSTILNHKTKTLNFWRIRYRRRESTLVSINLKLSKIIFSHFFEIASEGNNEKFPRNEGSKVNRN